MTRTSEYSDKAWESLHKERIETRATVKELAKKYGISEPNIYKNFKRLGLNLSDIQKDEFIAVIQ